MDAQTRFTINITKIEETGYYFLHYAKEDLNSSGGTPVTSSVTQNDIVTQCNILQTTNGTKDLPYGNIAAN
jgi:hypothetical protein